MARMASTGLIMAMHLPTVRSIPSTGTRNLMASRVFLHLRLSVKAAEPRRGTFDRAYRRRTAAAAGGGKGGPLVDGVAAGGGGGPARGGPARPSSLSQTASAIENHLRNRAHRPLTPRRSEK